MTRRGFDERFSAERKWARENQKCDSEFHAEIGEGYPYEIINKGH